MDIVAENFTKIEKVLNNRKIAVRWGLLTLCRIEFEFYAFAKINDINPFLNFSEIVDKCIETVCDNKIYDFSNDMENIRNYYEWLDNEAENGGEYNYSMPQLVELSNYLDYISDGSDEDAVTIAEFIMSAISEDYISDRFDIDLEDFSENKLVLDEIKRIWSDFDFVKACSDSELKELAESYRNLNVMQI